MVDVGNPLTDKAPDVEMGEAYNRPPTRAEDGGENKKKGNGTQTPSLNPNATPQRRNMGYRLNPAVFEFVKDIFEETYGFFLTRDVFADRSRSLLPLQGFPNAAAKVDQAVFIDADWTHLDKVLQWLKAAKVVALLIVPEFKRHTWYTTLEEKASHHMSLPLGTGLFVDKKGGDSPTPPTKIQCFFLDTRSPARATEKIIKITLPPLEKILTAPPLLPMQSCEFLKLRPKQHFKVEWFTKYGPKCLPPPLFKFCLTGLLKGFPTGYPGGGDMVRNYANKMKPEEERQ
jgi:hypothetical protein